MFKVKDLEQISDSLKAKKKKKGSRKDKRDGGKKVIYNILYIFNINIFLCI